MSAPALLRMLVLAGLACGCAATKSTREPRFDIAPFVEMAKNSTCSTIRRELYLIDNSYVFFDRAGSCPDNGYSQTLYGQRVDEVLCTSHDSIAGPVTRCADENRREMFETILEHVEETKLGLSSEHDVERIPL